MTVQTVNPTSRFARLRLRSGRLVSRRAARRTAGLLDGLVDSELEFVSRLPQHLRARPVEVLVVVAALASDYRYYARGWIGRRELQRRCERASVEVEQVGMGPAEIGPSAMNYLD